MHIALKILLICATTYVSVGTLSFVYLFIKDKWNKTTTGVGETALVCALWPAWILMICIAASMRPGETSH